LSLSAVLAQRRLIDATKLDLTSILMLIEAVKTNSLSQASHSLY
jgi:hypothetical protein